MMFIAVVINYMDRANFTVSVPLIEKQFGFDIDADGTHRVHLGVGVCAL